MSSSPELSPPSGTPARIRATFHPGGSLSIRSGTDGSDGRFRVALRYVCASESEPMESGGMMQFVINGKATDLEFDSRTSLLDLLRDHLSLTGSKKGCNQGACGACTVLVDGDRILSCLALAMQYGGSSITTVEGLAIDGELHPLQQAFIEHDGFQCGYCTPGQICSAVGMADELRRGVPSNVTHDLSALKIELSHDELRERMSGNLCRCGAYNGIVSAITEVYAKPAE